MNWSWAAVVPALILLSIIVLPMFVVVAVVYIQKRREARDERRSPFREKLLHQAGAQARRQAESLGDEIMARTALLMVIGPIAMSAILLPRVRWSHLQFAWLEWLLIAGAVVFTAWAVRDVVRFRRERRKWLNGMRGEMATAQSLDRLQAQGCMLFHDLPGDRGNIDHVVVAPNAVFAVETKWRSKRGGGKKSATVWFDGKALEFPNGYRDSKPVDQARACASELSKHLKGKTGEYVNVVPVVALPGWYVKNKANPLAYEAVAINPKLAYELLNRPGSPISQAQRNRLVHALSERYPELED